MEEEQLQDGEDGFRSGSRSAGGDTLSKNNGSTAAGLVDRSVFLKGLASFLPIAAFVTGSGGSSFEELVPSYVTFHD